MPKQSSVNSQMNALNNGGGGNMGIKAQANNLSNFLIVKFEVCPTNQESSTSKSKGKYKKCIKILSVMARPLEAPNVPASSGEVQLKTYEFTEKCLSFRLACLDLTSDMVRKSNFEIKLINLYEKFLCAAVNFTKETSAEQQQHSFKLYRIKHEETSSSTASTTTTTTSGTVASSNGPAVIKERQNSLPIISESNSQATFTTAISTESPTVNGPAAPNCLSATSSSRLNLTEFILTNTSNGDLDPTAQSELPQQPFNTNTKNLSLMPISVTTFDEENEVRFIALLNDQGVISIIDPFKCCKVTEFASYSSDDKVIRMNYCNGIDKICAVTENNRVYFISTRCTPIVNQSILDELSDNINLNEISLTKKLLVDAPLSNQVSGQCPLVSLS